MADRGHADPDQVVGRQLARTSASTSLSRSDGSYCRAPAHAANFRCPRPKAPRYRQSEFRNATKSAFSSSGSPILKR